MTERDRYPSEAADRFQVRMSAGLRERIRLAAEANDRSMNSEILATLEEKYAPSAVEEIAKRVSEILTYVDEMEPGYLPVGMSEELRALLKKLNDAKGIMG